MKTKHPMKPSTVLDVGQTLNLMSQTLCYKATNGAESAGHFQIQVCEPTMGETLAKQVHCTCKSMPFIVKIYGLTLHNIEQYTVVLFSGSPRACTSIVYQAPLPQASKKGLGMTWG